MKALRVAIVAMTALVAVLLIETALQEAAQELRKGGSERVLFKRTILDGSEMRVYQDGRIVLID